MFCVGFDLLGGILLSLLEAITAVAGFGLLVGIILRLAAATGS